MLLFLPGIALGGRHRDADGDEYRQQATEQFAEQDRQDQRRLEVGGECQVIADGGLGADAQGHAKHLVASIHVFEQVVGGDDVRQHLSKGLTFSREDRDTNISRIGYVCNLIAQAGGVAIAAPIAPYRSARRQVRQLAENLGVTLLEIYVATPLETCEQRDRKGLYAKARAGVIKNMTGIDDPYEPPVDPALAINTSGMTVAACVDQLMDYLRSRKLIR